MITTLEQFHGFYESCHDCQLDMALEQIMSDSSGCHPVSEKLSNDLHIHLNWGHVFPLYAQAYAEAFAEKLKAECKVEIEYEKMESPKEYNFTTDRIFCTISTWNFYKLFAVVKLKLWSEFLQKCKDKFTSRDGFSSFYSNDPADWGEPGTWDHNQVGTLLEVVADDMAMGKEWNSDDEMELVGDFSGNGLLDNWIYGEGQDPKAKRIMDIAGYLRRREERTYK